ncbi:MAG: alkyl sulfatase dimerization domain-containing protein [Pseudomonadota bacterium]
MKRLMNSKTIALAFGALSLGLGACERSVDNGPPVVEPLQVEGALSYDAPPVGISTAYTEAANDRIKANFTGPLDVPRQRAERGFIATIEQDEILTRDGRAVWSAELANILTGDAPTTVHPLLWQQSQLTAMHGLFEVTDGIYQVRGFDLAVMTVVRGETGWIIIDPLTTVETANAALELVQTTLGERPISAMIYTHSHADHFGGAEAIVAAHGDSSDPLPILAPIGFSDEAISENLLAGPHMARRAMLMYGAPLELGSEAAVGIGLGPTLSSGRISLVLPTEEIGPEPTTRLIDGIEFQFLDAANTEAPAEFVFYLPQFKALCTAEVVTGTFHNILTMRGAKVRDALRWSQVIDQIILEFADEAEVLFASHHWPVWERDQVEEHLRLHRDLYRSLHDQTLRLANGGATIDEISSLLRPLSFEEDELSVRSFYGTTEHNVKGVYQFYFGWWDGVPANYYRHPPEARATRFIDSIGGADKAIEIGKAAFNEGDYRWAAEVFNAAVFAGNEGDAHQWLAATYEQLGFQAESGAWRNYFLSAASELRSGVRAGSSVDEDEGTTAFLATVPTPILFDALAARYNPQKLDRDPYTIEFRFTDSEEVISVEVGRDVAFPRVGVATEEALATFSTTRKIFDGLITGQHNAMGLVLTGQLKIGGNRDAVSDFFDALDEPRSDFPVVTP